ncbi:MAG: glycosyltransferase family 4 protein [Rubrivivax sp.]|nr:glycosyltransferase family 4 protein [Rubrivivax sp.]
MKILYHHRTASKDGQAVHIEEMITALRELGHEVMVVAPQAPTGAGMGGEVGWVQQLRARLPKAVYEILELAYSALAYVRLARAAKAFAPDVIYERYYLFLLACLMLKRRRRIPLLLEVNAPLVDERMRFGGLGLPWLARWAEGLAWRGADVVLPVTQVLGGHVSQRGVPAERIVVIPNGINEAHFSAAPTIAAAKAALGWDGALVLGFTGFVRDWHGVDRVLHWMASTDAPANARLLVVGDGPARADLEALALELQLGERVRFTGVIDREHVPAHVAAFDIALQPAVVPYASPLKLFEYLALGKAIVAPRQPNIEEVLSDGSNALLFDAAAPGAFEAALTRLCADAALRERIAAGSAATITRMGLTWRGNAQRVVVLAGRLRAQDGAVAAPTPSASR